MNQPFEIFAITEPVVRDIMTNPAHPHRHDHEEILIITSGQPNHYVDFIDVSEKAPVVIYVAQGKVHEFMPDAETRGWCIRYRGDFVPESNFHFFSNYTDQITFTFDPGTCPQEIGVLCGLIFSEYEKNRDKPEIYRNLFRALLAKLDAEGAHSLPRAREGRTSQEIAFRSFLNILEDNYRRDEDVSFYADKMFTSVRNLNHLCKKMFGKSVSEIIETRKLIEARRMLLGTDMTVSEIGYVLGYNEKSYFTRVFKKRTGITPTLFRESVMS